MSSLDSACRNCEEPLGLFPDRSLPIDNNCDFVPGGDTTKEWGGVPCCKICYDLHVAAGPTCNAVLRAYADAVIELRDQRALARQQFAGIVERAESALRELNR